MATNKFFNKITFFVLFLMINILYSHDLNPSNLKQEDSKKISNIGNFLAPAQIVKDTYASFVIGYEMLFKKFNNTIENKEGIFFAFDRGWNFIDNILLFGFSIDGSAGAFYSLNINTKIGARVFDGRVIPSLSVGYGILNHLNGNVQDNLYGANATASLFIDIAKGFGIEASYRIGLHPFRLVKRNTNFKLDKMSAFMVSFKFMDFTI